MLKVKLIDPNGDLSLFLESRTLSDWGRPIHIKAEHEDGHDFVLDLSSALWQNVVGTTARLINFRAEKDTFFIPAFAAARFAEWKTSGYPSADEGIVPFLETILASGMYWPVWSCVGHHNAFRTPWENSGYVTITGSYAQLLVLEQEIYSRFKNDDTGLDNISLEMNRLIHQPNGDWSEVVMYPCLTVRWFGESEDELKTSFGIAQKLLLDAITATTPKVIC